jgi:hypothetical protein
MKIFLDVLTNSSVIVLHCIAFVRLLLLLLVGIIALEGEGPRDDIVVNCDCESNTEQSRLRFVVLMT